MSDTPNVVTTPVVLLTPAEVAKRTGVSIGYLAKKRCLGGGPPFVDFAGPKYPSDLFEQWLADQPRRRSTSDTAALRIAS